MEKEMVKDYILPDQRKAGKRSRNAAENVSASFSALSQEIGFDKKYFIRTYGCQANVRDGETISGLMELMGLLLLLLREQYLLPLQSR